MARQAVALRAVACAGDMQAAVREFPPISLPGRQPVSLAVKVAVASGPARRFVVGDPAFQLIDTLAGQTLARVAAAEHLAGPGDVVLDESTWSSLSAAGPVPGCQPDWRVSDGQSFAVLSGLPAFPAVSHASPVAGLTLPPEVIRPWVIPAVWDRLQAGLGEFLAELRPATALFLNFEGIDYDGDEAACQVLDAFIRRVQAVLSGLEGTFMQLTIGDKGNYFYASFGAPVAHEDDARRALSAALELRSASLSVGLPPV